MIYLCNYKKDVREPTIYQYNFRQNSDSNNEVKLNFGVIGKCLSKKSALCEQLPENHFETYPEDIQSKISPDIKIIIVAPIFDSQQKIIAVMTIEILKTPGVTIKMEKLRLDDREALGIAQRWADSLSYLIEI